MTQGPVKEVAVAQHFGIFVGLLLEDIHYWNAFSANHIGTVHEGRRWVYNTYKGWVKRLGGLVSERTLRRKIKELEKQGILLSKNLNKKKSDRTKWYAIDYEVLRQFVPSAFEKIKSVTQEIKKNFIKLASQCGQDVQFYKETPITSETGLKQEENNHFVTEIKTELQSFLTKTGSQEIIQEPILRKTITKLQKTHLPTVDSWKQMLKDCQNNLYLTGRKAMKSGDRFFAKIGFLLSETNINAWIRKEKHHNIWTTKPHNDKERDMEHSQESASSLPISREQAMSVANCDRAKAIIGNLYDTLGKDTYNAWFYTNGFLPIGGLGDNQPLFDIRTQFARDEIVKRFGEEIMDAFQQASGA